MDENRADPPIHPVGELPTADQELTAEETTKERGGGARVEKLFVLW